MSPIEHAAGRAPRRSRADVVDAALEILDGHGLGDLTMRRVGAALGVQPSALYWHFPNKQSLLAGVSERILDAAPATAADTDWRTAARADANGLRTALLRVTDGAETVASSLALGLSGDDVRARIVGTITRGGFSAEHAATAADALLHYLLGFVAAEQQHAQAERLGALPAGVATTGPSSADRFAFGIELLLTGLEHTAPAHAAHSPAPAEATHTAAHPPPDPGADAGVGAGVGAGA